MKKLLILLIGVFIFSIGCTKINKPEKYIIISQNQLMLVYQHGYVSGSLNQMFNARRPISYDNQWKKDSLFIINSFKNSFK